MSELWNRLSPSPVSYLKAVVVHVEDEVLAHHGQPDQGNIASVGRENNLVRPK